MIQLKRLLSAGAVAFALGMTLVSTSYAGPIVLGPGAAPVTIPKVFVTPSVRMHTLKSQFLSSYRQMRTFWLSRAIVR
jgi:hypothetical protein